MLLKNFCPQFPSPGVSQPRPEYSTHLSMSDMIICIMKSTCSFPSSTVSSRLSQGTSLWVQAGFSRKKEAAGKEREKVIRKEEGRKGGRKGEREGGRESGKEGGREGRREEEREGGRERGKRERERGGGRERGKEKSSTQY